MAMAPSFSSLQHALNSTSSPSQACFTLSPLPCIRSFSSRSLSCFRRPFLPLISAKSFDGPCFVVQNNIDTDQIIPTEHLTLVPSKPLEYEQLGSLALIGLPASYPRFVEEGQTKTKYPILIAGANFGCGSSREHAPVSLGASGVKAVVAESYARIFFRNCVSTGELYPAESETKLCEECKTGDQVTVDLDRNVLINHTQNKQYALKPLGDAGPVIEAGGLFAYARKTGMIATSAA